MHGRRAAVLVVAVAGLWGLYWVPLRQLDSLVDGGAWTTLAALMVALIVLAPSAWRGRQRLRAEPLRVWLGMFIGGGAFVLYSNGLLYGQVATVILLFYLTPIWSTLIARYGYGRRLTAERVATIALALAGVLCVLHAGNGGWPWPRSVGDWLGLASGALWAVAATAIHGQNHARPAEVHAIFCLGAAITAAVSALMMADAPEFESLAAVALPALGWLLLLGAGWWAGSLSLFIGAARGLEPARIGILMMSEVIVGTLSAAAFAPEPFGLLMVLGTVLVIAAGLLETRSAE